MCYECYRALWLKAHHGESEALSERRVHRQAAARPGGLQDALERHPMRAIRIREDRSPRFDDPGAIQGLLRARVHPEPEH